MTDDIVFGTDILRDGISKVVDICVAVNGGKIPDEGGYKDLRLYHSVTTDDEIIIDFFAKELGTRRKAITFLISAGLRKLYLESDKYPTSVFQMKQVLGEIARIDEVGYVIQDEVKLEIPVRRCKLLDYYRLEVPYELWGFICAISRNLGLYPSHAMMYMIRTGVSEYNEFIDNTHFSTRVNIKLRPRILEGSKWSGEIFLRTFGRIYKRLLNTIIDLDTECKDNGYYQDIDTELVKEIENIRKENNI